MSKLPKIFVLDTNIILHDNRAIHHFQENDIVIPIAVIEELDKFKKGDEEINYHAREFVRQLDKLAEKRLFTKPIPLGKNLGTIKIEMNHPFPEGMEKCFMDDIQDHRIISTALWVRDNNPDRYVALVTKDLNMRMKAKAIGLNAEDYLTDRIDEERLYEVEKGIIETDEIEPSLVQKMAYSTGNIPLRDLHWETPKANQLYKIHWGNGSAKETVCARYDDTSRSLVFVRKQRAAGISPRNDEQKFAMDACMNPEIELVALTGGPGTGKTLIALAAAIAQERRYEQIILARPVIPMGNQDVGFLPGDAEKKVGPYMLPLLDNLNVIKEALGTTSKEVKRIEGLSESGKLEISPLAYIRGRSLSKVYFIIDEAQNLTPHEIKTIITRAGEGTKIVFTGDVFQIDQPYLDMYSNGLTHLKEKMSGVPIFQHVNLKKGERSKLSELAGKLL